MAGAGPLVSVAERVAPVALGLRTPRVAIVHDYLTQRGGAERVVLALARAFPDAPVHTTLYDPDGTFPGFADLDVRTSPLQRVTPLRRHHLYALPLLPSAMRGIDVGDVDVVVASSSGWAHGIRTSAPVLVYCHNTPRWLHQQQDYRAGLGPVGRAALTALRQPLLAWDRRAAARATAYVANSPVVADRVTTAYGRTAQVVPPPVGLDPDAHQEPIPGLAPGFLLTVGRPRAYKHTEVVVSAMRALPGERLVVVGLDPATLPAGVLGLRGLTDAQMRWLYANADAVLSASHEDFGLTPLEANTLGTPAVVLRAGGFLSTVDPGVSGVYIDALSAASVASAVRDMRSRTWDPDAIRDHAAAYAEARFHRTMQRWVDMLAGVRPGIDLTDDAACA